MKRLSFLITLFLLTTLITSAQTSFQIIPPRNVIAGQKFRVVYRLNNGEGSSPNAPEIKGCTMLYGPSTSTSSSTQIINGHVSSSFTIDYTYTYLAEKEGNYTIPEATIVVDGKKLTAESKSFTVLPADQPSNSNTGSRAQLGNYDTQTPDRAISKDDIFVRIILNKSSVYEQEAIECIIKLYTKYESISSFSQSAPANYEGFLIEESQQSAQLNDIENYNGQNYRTAILKKAIIFPQKSGNLKVNSGSYEVVVQQLERVSNGYFYMTRPVERVVKLPASTATVNVKALPSPQPIGFNGAVGNFTMTSELSSNQLRTGEAASLTLKVRGSGNIKYLKQPIVEFPSEFEQYTPKQEFTTNISGTTVAGEMIAEYTFVPSSVGTFDIKSPTLVYFNPSSGEYKTIETGSYIINVAKGAGSTTTVEQQDIKLKNTDILHIHLGDKNQSKAHTYYAFKAWYWLIYVALTATFVVGCIVATRRIKSNADVKGRKMSRANKVARKRLALAEKAMKSGSKDEFYDAILKAIWGYLSDKFAIPVSSLTRSNIQEELERHGASEELTKQIINVLDNCEMARYTPDDANLSPEAIYADALSAISL